MAKSNPQSDLEVYLPPSFPEVDDHANFRASATSPAVYHSGSGSNQSEPKLQDTPRRRMKSLSNRAFWALVAIALVLILAAALGGGLVAGLSRRPGAAPAAQIQTSPIPNSATFATSYLNSESTNTANPITTTTTSAVQISLTRIINPTSTGKPSALIRDCPSSDNTLYSIRFGSTNFDFRKICAVTIENTGSGNAVQASTVSLNECINLCAAWNSDGGSPPCETVCWRNSFRGNDRPGVCFGFQTTNTSTGFAVEEPNAPICDSAVWINQP
jgi:hypothetical protein